MLNLFRRSFHLSAEGHVTLLVVSVSVPRALETSQLLKDHEVLKQRHSRMAVWRREENATE